MTSSIYHFFKFLVNNPNLTKVSNLEELDFDDSFVSSKSAGVFPDLAIKINLNDDVFTGGELVEFKGSRAYNISSFNSTIPTGRKAICDIIDNSPSVRTQMQEAGNNINSMPFRDVYYLISGKKKGDMKIVLVHGSFFETIPVNELIRKAFGKILKEVDPVISDDEINKFSALFSKQKLFSSVKRIDQSAVKIRFRIMTEAETNANLLNSKIYPEIKTNTINLCIPYKDKEEKISIINRFNKVFGPEFDTMDLVHKINNEKYVLFQNKIKEIDTL